ncbi:MULTISPECIES: ABC transporter ATP-binding protein [Streptomyces]|nr:MULTISPECIES: ATP-binding cassette domain-containing protein [Streptomyces]MYT01333.1 ATP-binding cassette domain-containing protein [Streptomyces sp. SID5469]GDY65962.1 hypothetical protein SAV14893_053550 [Streptomyces avermitilis]GDY73821.1 hypothetical protein SAV31267_033060 [Streptomyces avermitilis]GDY82903.1 hypothetical protein SAVCW2_21020 [Streptomyces avermitilis]
MSEILTATGVDLSYGNQPAVRDAHLSVSPGEVVAITGQSGSGKSSLLYCLAGVLPATRGQVRFEGRALGDLADEEISVLRRERFGFVFQYGELLPELTVEENTALPLRLAGQRKGPALAAAGEVLERLGLGGLRERRPAQVSGGQSQRVAVARSLVHRQCAQVVLPLGFGLVLALVTGKLAESSYLITGGGTVRWDLPGVPLLALAAAGVVAAAAASSLPLVGRRVDPELIRRD